MRHLPMVYRTLWNSLSRYKKRWGSRGQTAAMEERSDLQRACLPLWMRLRRLHRKPAVARERAWVDELARPEETLETLKGLNQAYWPLWCHLQRYTKGAGQDESLLAEEEERELKVLLEVIEEAYWSLWCRLRGKKALAPHSKSATEREKERSGKSAKLRDLEELLIADVALHDQYMAMHLADLRRYFERLKVLDVWPEGGVDPAELDQEDDAEDSSGKSATIHSYSPSTAGLEDEDTVASDFMNEVLECYATKPDSHDNEVAAALEAGLANGPPAPWPPRPSTPYPLAVDFTETAASWLERTRSARECEGERVDDAWLSVPKSVKEIDNAVESPEAVVRRPQLSIYTNVEGSNGPAAEQDARRPSKVVSIEVKPPNTASETSARDALNDHHRPPPDCGRHDGCGLGKIVKQRERCCCDIR